MGQPYREAAVVDQTELEATKIREDAATKRKQIEEREETRRDKKWSDDARKLAIYSVSITTILVVAMGSAVGGISYGNYLDSKESCRDTLLTTYGGSHPCPPGATLSIEGNRGVCRCQPAPPPLHLDGMIPAPTEK